jgi:hypothetical protein
VNPWNRRIALAAALAALATPALAADPAPDCTVCSDPTWPTLTNPMPAIPLYAEAAPSNASSPGGVAPWLAASYRSPGVGVAAADGAAGTVYSDPTWPQMKAPAAGMAAAATPAPVPAKAAAPAKPVVAAR